MNRLVLPLVIPLLTAIILLFAPRKALWQRWISFAGSIGLLAAAIALFLRIERDGIAVLQAGGWRAPFGITLVADLLAAMLVVAAGIVAVAVTATSFAGVDPKREASGYHPLLHVLFMGVCGAFLTGDLFNPTCGSSDAGGVVCLDGAAPDEGAVGSGFQVRHSEPDRLSVFLTALVFCTAVRGPEPGRSEHGVSGTGNGRLRTGAGDAFSSPLSASKRPCSRYFSAARLVSHAAGRRGGGVRGAADESGDLFADRVFTLLFRDARGRGIRCAGAGAMHHDRGAGRVRWRSATSGRVLSFNLIGHLGYHQRRAGAVTPAAMAGSILYILHQFSSSPICTW